MNGLVELFKAFLIRSMNGTYSDDYEGRSIEEIDSAIGALEAQPHLRALFRVMQTIERRGEPTLTIGNKDKRWPNTIIHMCAAVEGNRRLLLAGAIDRNEYAEPALKLFRAIADKLSDPSWILEGCGTSCDPSSVKVKIVSRNAFECIYVAGLEAEEDSCLDCLRWGLVECCEGWLDIENAVELVPGIKSWFERGLESAQNAWDEAAREYPRSSTVTAYRNTGNRRKRTKYVIVRSDCTSYRFTQYCKFRAGRDGFCTVVVTPHESGGLQVVSNGLHLSKAADLLPSLELNGDVAGVARDIDVEALTVQLVRAIETPPKRERTERLNRTPAVEQMPAFPNVKDGLNRFEQIAANRNERPDDGRVRPQDLARERVLQDKAKHFANKRADDGPTAMRPETVLTGEPVRSPRPESRPKAKPKAEPRRKDGNRGRRRPKSQPLTHNPFAVLANVKTEKK